MTHADVPETLLTLEDVARLAAAGDQLPRALVPKLRAVVRSDPRFAPHFEQLEALAREAGLDPASETGIEDGFAAHQDLERLLAAEGWAHPAEVLDPAGEVGVACGAVLRIARARLEQAGEEPGPLREVVAKLERAATMAELWHEVGELGHRLEGTEVPSAKELTLMSERINTVVRRMAASDPENPAKGDDNGG